MAFRRVVVDGSNIATEGRSVPSLAQLDEAVREFQREYPDAEVTVVVDASFGHRIDESERMAFDEAEDHGEIVSPPAGAIGRGDAFLLRIAEKTGATVLSNDSFQEFHGEHEWLFSQSRLVGGKPVPGVGWIFTPRTPVRGPRSRVATQDAKRARVRVGSKEASKPMPVPASPPPGRGRRDGRAKEPADGAGAAKESADGAGAAKAGAVKEATPPADPKVRRAIAAATEEVVSPQTSSGGRRRRRGSGPPPQAVNDPLTFIRFIAEHPLGQQLEGEVEGFTSHGAFVRIEDAQAYVPVSGLGDPPPRSARRVLRRGERRPFVLQALDPQRRGVELALPEYAQVAGSPSEETV
ncbi:MAG TPA: S1 RNA-binding domain-containing protein, partial [Acidimicrobiales bacterium]